MQFPKLKSPALLSPMAGVTDVAFRSLAKDYGVGMTYTEFVSSTAIVRENQKTLRMLQTAPNEKPVAVQLFGNNLDDLLAAAKAVEERFDVIDINCGCPAWKVIKTGAGSALLNNPPLIAKIVERLTKAVSIPVTVKIRKGISEEKITAPAIAKAVEDAGAAAITIHGRTQKQGYQGKADWEIIKQIKQQVNIAVIGNGDVFTPEIFKQRLEETKVDAIMVARGAIGNPYLFQQINDYLTKGHYQTISRIAQLRAYYQRAKHWQLPFSQIKNQAISFLKGMSGAAQLRMHVTQIKTQEVFEEFLAELDDNS